MRTLRVKLHIPEDDTRDTERQVFDMIADIHSDQAIFQVNESEYITDERWGFAITYWSQRTFIQTTSPADVEHAMWQVAPPSFERRLSGE
jgi:hypothetical protein